MLHLLLQLTIQRCLLVYIKVRQALPASEDLRILWMVQQERALLQRPCCASLRRADSSSDQGFCQMLTYIDLVWSEATRGHACRAGAHQIMLHALAILLLGSRFVCWPSMLQQNCCAPIKLPPDHSGLQPDYLGMPHALSAYSIGSNFFHCNSLHL